MRVVFLHEYGENINSSECGRVNQAAGDFRLPSVLPCILPFLLSLPVHIIRLFRDGSLPWRILLRQWYQPFPVRIRIVEQFVEHIGGKWLTQT